MLGNLLIKNATGDQTLDAFVASLSQIVGCGQWEQRQSSNYVQE